MRCCAITGCRSARWIIWADSARHPAVSAATRAGDGRTDATVRPGWTINRRPDHVDGVNPQVPQKAKPRRAECRAGLLQDLRDKNDADCKSLGGEYQNEAGRRLEEFHYRLLRRARLPALAHLVMRCGRHKIISTRRNFETDNRGCRFCNRGVKCVRGTLRCSRAGWFFPFCHPSARWDPSIF